MRRILELATQYNYDRRYELYIGRPPKLNYQTSATPISNGHTSIFKVISSFDYRSEVSGPRPPVLTEFPAPTTELDAVLITDLHFTANIKSTNKTTSTSASNATFTLFGLHPQTRDIVERVNNYVILKAGYAWQKDLPIVYTGQVQFVDTVKDAPEVITTLECKEGYTLRDSIKVSYSRPYQKVRQDTFEDVFRDLAAIYQSNGIAIGRLVLDEANITAPYETPVPSKTPLSNGWRFGGLLSDAMDKLCSEFDYTHYIVNSKLYVQPKRYDKMVSQVEVDTTQIKSIRKQQSNSGVSSTTPNNPGVAITLQLFGEIDISKKLKVLDGDYSGTYKITAVSHNLSYEGQEWDTSLICEVIS